MALVDEVEEWLCNMHSTLWSDWDITQTARRRLAAEWFVDQMRSFSGWRTNAVGPFTQLQQQESRRGN